MRITLEASVVEPGGNVTFTVTVTNESDEDVTITSLEDSIFGTLDDFDRAADLLAGSELSLAPFDLPLGEYAKLEIDVSDDSYLLVAELDSLPGRSPTPQHGDATYADKLTVEDRTIFMKIGYAWTP